MTEQPRLGSVRAEFTESLRRSRPGRSHEMAYSAMGQKNDLRATLRKGGIVMTLKKSPSTKEFTPEDEEASFFAAMKSVVHTAFEKQLEAAQVDDAWSFLSDAIARGTILGEKKRLSEKDLSCFCKTVQIFLQHLKDTPELEAPMEHVITVLQNACFSIQKQSSPQELWVYTTLAIPHELSEESQTVVTAVLQRILSVLLFNPDLTTSTIKLYEAYHVKPSVHVHAIMTAVASACPHAVFHEAKAKLAAKEASQLSKVEESTLQTTTTELQKQRPQIGDFDSALTVNVIYAETASRPIHQPFCRVTVNFPDSPKRKRLPKNRDLSKINCDTRELFWNETVSFLLQTGDTKRTKHKSGTKPKAGETGEDSTVNVTVTLYETSSVKKKPLGTATISIRPDDPAFTHGNEQWMRVKVPLLPKSSGDGDRPAPGSCVSNFVLVELCLLRFYKLPEAELFYYKILVKKLSDFEAPMVHESVKYAEDGHALAIPSGCSYPLFSTHAQGLARQYVTRFCISQKASIALLNELSERLGHETLSPFLLQSTGKQLNVVVRAQSQFTEQEKKYRDQVLASLRSQSDHWIEHFFLAFLDIYEVECALTLWVAIQRASENSDISGSLTALCRKAAEFSLHLESSDCAPKSSNAFVEVSNYSSFVDRLLDSLDRYARKYQSIFHKYDVDLVQVFCRAYTDYFRVHEEKNLIKSIENSVKIKQGEQALKLFNMLNQLSAEAVEACAGSKEKIEPLPICRWFDPFFESIIWITYMNTYNQTRTQSLLQDSWKPALNVDGNPSSSVTDLFDLFWTATKELKSEFPEQFSEDKSVVNPFLHKVWKAHTTAVCGTIMSYSQDIELLFKTNFVPDQLFTGTKQEAMTLVIPSTSSSSAPVQKELSPLQAPPTIGIKAKPAPPPTNKNVLALDNYTTTAAELYCLLLQNIEAAHTFLTNLQEDIEKDRSLSEVTDNEEISQVFQRTHVGLREASKSIINCLAMIPSQRLTELINNHFFGKKAVPHKELVRKLTQVSIHLRQSSEAGLLDSSSSKGDIIFDSLNVLLGTFASRLKNIVPICRMFVSAVWDSTVHCMEETAVSHADSFPAGSEKATDFMEFVRTLRIMFCIEGCEFSVSETDASRGIAMVDACISMLSLDDAQLHDIAKSDNKISSSAASHIIVYRKVHHHSPLLKKLPSPTPSPTSSPSVQHRHKFGLKFAKR